MEYHCAKFLRLDTACIVAGVFVAFSASADPWENVNSSAWHLRDVSFADDTTGWAISKSGVLTTTDGGSSWRKMDSPGGLSIWFWDTQQGVMSTETEILETSDGGNTWDVISVLPPQYGDTDIFKNQMHFVDRNTGWVGVADSLFHTTDGGHTWIFISLDFPEWESYSYRKWCCKWIHIHDVYFADRDWGWVVGGWILGAQSRYMIGFVFETRDGGQTWHKWGGEVVSWGGGYIYGAFGFSAEHAWVVGTNERILRRSLSAPVPFSSSIRPQHSHFISEEYAGPGEDPYGRRIFALSDIWFSDSLTGWAVGDRILHTTDGGETWIEEFAVSEDLYLTKIVKAGNRLISVGLWGNILVRNLPESTTVESTSWGTLKLKHEQAR